MSFLPISIDPAATDHCIQCPARCSRRRLVVTGRVRRRRRLYAIAIPLAFWSEWISLGLYVLVALIWLVPDRRIEQALPSTET